MGCLARIFGTLFIGVAILMAFLGGGSSGHSSSAVEDRSNSFWKPGETTVWLIILGLALLVAVLHYWPSVWYWIRQIPVRRQNRRWNREVHKRIMAEASKKDAQ